MNTKTQHRYGLYLPLILLLSTAACILRTVAAFLGVNAYGYFEASTLHSVSVWLLVTGVLIMLTYPLAYARRTDVLVRHTTPLTFLPSLLVGMTMIFFVVDTAADIFSSRFAISTDTVTLLLVTVLGAISTVYFFALAIVESGVSDRKANFGMALVLFLGAFAAHFYLNPTLPRNSHIELTEEMTFVALSLFFLYEIRISLGKQKQNLYVCFGFIGAMLSAYQAIPALIYYVVKGRLLAYSTASLLLVLAFFLFILARLFLFNISPEDAPIPFVQGLIDSARLREQTVREVEALFAPDEPTPEVVEENAASQNSDPDAESAEPQDPNAQAEGAEPQDSDAQAESTQVQDYDAQAEDLPTEDTSLQNASEDAPTEEALTEEAEIEEQTAPEEPRPTTSADEQVSAQEVPASQAEEAISEDGQDAVLDVPAPQDSQPMREFEFMTDTEPPVLMDVPEDAPVTDGWMPVQENGGAQTTNSETGAENEEDTGH